MKPQDEPFKDFKFDSYGRQTLTILKFLLPIMAILSIVFIIIFADAIDQAPWWVQFTLVAIPVLFFAVTFVLRRFNIL